jgi:hypothetical protein
LNPTAEKKKTSKTMATPTASIPKPSPPPTFSSTTTNTMKPKRRTRRVKASQAKNMKNSIIPSAQPRRSRFSMLRKSKRPKRFQRIDAQIEARIRSEAKLALEVKAHNSFSSFLLIFFFKLRSYILFIKIIIIYILF